MELTATVKNKLAKSDAMAAAHKAGHPEVVLMILSDQIVVRLRRSGPPGRSGGDESEQLE